MADDVDIRVRTRGARQASTELKSVATAEDEVGLAAKRANRNLGYFQTGLRSAWSNVEGFGRALKTTALYGTGFAAAVASYGAYAGLKFDASMESNTTAFKHFLGSSKAAGDYLQKLYHLAAVTPFEFPDVTAAAQKFLAFGFSAKQAYSTLKVVGDAAAGLGTNAEGIERITLALGQIKAKGRLQGDELLQLNEAGINARKYLLDYLGWSQKKLDTQMRKGKVSSDTAIAAITKGMKKEFGGLSEAQSKTFSGQLSTLKDNANQTMGNVMLPLFKELRDNVFPDLNKASLDLSKTFGRTDLSFHDKLVIARKELKRDLDPLWQEIETSWKNAHVEDWLTKQFNAAAPKIASAAGHAAAKAVPAFVNAWLHSDGWGRLFLDALILSKLGVFKVAGKAAMDRFATSYKARARTQAAEMGAATAAGTSGGFVGGVGPAMEKGVRGKGVRASMSRIGTVLGGLVGAAFAYQLAHDVAMSVPALSQYSGSKGWGELGRDIKDWLPGEDSEAKRKRQAALVASGQGPTSQPLRSGMLLRPVNPLNPFGPMKNTPRSTPRSTKSTTSTTKSTSAPVTFGLPSDPIHVHVNIDGKKVAEAVAKQTRNTANRR